MPHRPVETARSLTVLQELARGGMGTVELVMRRDGGFRRLYALKRPHAELCGDPSFQVEIATDAGRGLVRDEMVPGEH